MEVDSGRRREFESKLAEAMQQLRQDHESQLQQYKEEIDKTFTSKVQTHAVRTMLLSVHISETQILFI